MSVPEVNVLTADGGVSEAISPPQDKFREFPCESCGAKLEFHIGQQQLKCPYCGFEKALTLSADQVVSEQDLEATLARLERGGELSNMQLGQLEISCQGCSASVAFNGQLSTTECPFCGATIQRKDAHQSESRLKVDAVVPFQITEARARELLRSWIQSLWFAPTEFTRRGVTGKFNGIYLPFWTFDAMTFCRYQGARGTHYTVTSGSGKDRRTETRTKWTAVSGSFDRFFDDVAEAATSSFDCGLLQQLEPWPVTQALPFNSELIAGKKAMTYDVDLRAGFAGAKTQIEAALESEARSRIGGDEQRIDDLAVQYSALTFKHTLFPVWMLAYRYYNKPYQIMVNAITGEVQGERPWSAWKIAGAVLLVLLVLVVWLSFKQ